MRPLPAQRAAQVIWWVSAGFWALAVLIVLSVIAVWIAVLT